MKKLALYAVVFCLLCGLTNAAENGAAKPAFTKRPLVNAPDGFTTTLTRKQRTLFLKEKIQVDPAATYQCTVNAAAAADAKGILYIGTECFDKDGKRIWPEYIYTVKESETVLAKDAAAGSKSVVVKIAKGWEGSKGKYVAFNAKADKSDLPNRTANKIVSATKEGDNVVLTLAKPLKEAYTQGTALRLHRHGAIYSNVGAKSFKVNTTFSLKTTWQATKLAPGTASFALCIYTSANGEVKLSDIEFGTVNAQ